MLHHGEKKLSEQIPHPILYTIYFTMGKNNFVDETIILVSISFVLEGCHNELKKQMECICRMF
jgi:hypothetical protein